MTLFYKNIQFFDTFHSIMYALDIVFPDLKRPTKEKLEKAMEGHVLSQAELIGLYQR